MSNQKPLAERVRPKTLEEYVGQEHLLGEGGILRQAIKNKNVPSIIFWGPPGVGKTTLANIIAWEMKMPFYLLSAINSGVQDLRKVIDEAKTQGKALLFIDEIHRFNKSQQDALLGAVEKGIITLIGATTENPSFEVISALLSRCQVYILKELSDADLSNIVKNAIVKDTELSRIKIELKETEALFRLSGGDARKVLGLLELTVNYSTTEPIVITDELVSSIAHKKIVLYDKAGEQHYNIISAFIKSMRGSDPNAAVYWMARMLEGGEDIKFIARRMIILASEDIGNANPTALIMANNCFQAINVIGMPEARIILAQTVIYLAGSPKSNAAYTAISDAMELVRKTGEQPVPLHLRKAETKLMEKFEYGKGYAYAHDHENNFVELEFFPEKLSGTKLFEPGNNDRERELRSFLKKRWKEKYGY
jgi:putative ATPase